MKQLIRLFKRWKSNKAMRNDPATRGTENPLFSEKLKKQINAVTKDSESFILFEKQAIELVLNHIENTEFAKHRSLIREISFLLYYTFAILKDDYFIGDKIFKKGITRIDDYIFSQYRKNPKLSSNIKKMTTLSFSNRFDEHPRNNLLAYFVFIEETGFELILLLEDFYKMLENSQKKKFDFGFKKNNGLNKSYKKGVTQENASTEDDGVLTQTLYSEEMSEFIPAAVAQRKIIEELLKKEKSKK